jgi:hypothetical protein
MFNRRLAVTFIPNKGKNDETTESPNSLEQIGETLVNTSAGIGTVVIVVAGAMTALRITETVVKHIFK